MYIYILFGKILNFLREYRVESKNDILFTYSLVFFDKNYLILENEYNFI